jgi:hypothetical protein
LQDADTRRCTILDPGQPNRLPVGLWNNRPGSGDLIDLTHIIAHCVTT